MAYISNVSGDVTVRRGDSGANESAAINAPLMVGDYLSTNDGARSEIQFDYGHVLRVGPDSQLRFDQLGSNDDTVQLAAGSVGLGVIHGTSDYTQIETLSVTVRPRGRGYYRVTVNPDETTSITVHSGDAAILLPQGTQTLAPGSTMIVWGPAAHPSWRFEGPVGADPFDQWNLQRDAAFDGSNAYQYAPSWMPGAYDLAGYGAWQTNPSYGNVWIPNDEPAGWTPYSTGHWMWEPYYGWTWVDNDPWGYAPFHYGRWFYDQHVSRWAWAPGGTYAAVQPWSPALVAFVGFGGGGISIGVSLLDNIGWVPLAPYEPVHPWWGSAYRSGVAFDVTNVRNVYVNAHWPNAVRGVSRTAFANGRYQRANPISEASFGRAAIVRNGLPVVPGAQALRFGNRNAVASRAPSPQAFHAFRTAPRAPANFAQQRRQVTAYTQHARVSAVAAAHAFAPRQGQARFAPGGQQRPQFAMPGQHRAAFSPQGRPQRGTPARPQFAAPQRVAPARPQYVPQQRPQYVPQARPAAPQARQAGPAQPQQRGRDQRDQGHN